MIKLHNHFLCQIFISVPTGRTTDLIYCLGTIFSTVRAAMPRQRNYGSTASASATPPRHAQAHGRRSVVALRGII